MSRAVCLPLLLVCVSLIGCGDGRPSRVPVAGQVLIDGKPLTLGTVQIFPDNARPAMGAIGKDGRFKLMTFTPDDGCVLGRHRVVVHALEVLNPGAQKWHAPKKYSEIEESELMVDINGPTDDLTLNLTWAGGKPFIETFDGKE